MNIFIKKLFRSKAFTSLTILFMAAAVALLSIGICAWWEIRAQLERVGEQYTTIAVPNPYTFTPAILWREGDKTWLPLTRQERKYPGLLTEDLRGFLTARVAGCGALSCYDVGEYRNAEFDVYGAAMAVVAAKCTSVQDSSHLIEYTRTLEDGTTEDIKYRTNYYDTNFSVEEIVCRHPAYSELPELKELNCLPIFTPPVKKFPLRLEKHICFLELYTAPCHIKAPMDMSFCSLTVPCSTWTRPHSAGGSCPAGGTGFFIGS